MTDDALRLHHALVASADGAAPPDRWLLVLHGILGSGSNFRSFARRVATACPTWGFVICDLRAHGLSQGARPPHTIDAAAEDLVRLEARLAAEGQMVAGVLGHSFGGKVAIAYAARRAAGPARRSARMRRRGSRRVATLDRCPKVAGRTPHDGSSTRISPARSSIASP